jgi:hypothetical protein
VLLEGPAAVAAVCHALTPEDFYYDAHRLTFAAMVDMATHSQPIDVITLAHALVRRGTFQDAGGNTGLALLEEYAAVRSNLAAYIGIVRDTAIRRELIEKAAQLGREAQDDGADVLAILEDTRGATDRLATRMAAAENLFPALRVAELARKDIPEPVFLVDKWICAGKLSFLVGDSEAFKSWFALYLGLCVSMGHPVFDRIPTTQTPVAIISEENGEDEDKRRLVVLARGMGLDLDKEDPPCFVVSESSFSFDDPARYAAMRAFFTREKIGWGQFDSFVRMHRRVEKEASDMSALYMDRIRPLLHEGRALSALHHRRKVPAGSAPQGSDNDEIRGSGDIRAAANSVLFLRTLIEGGEGTRARILVRHNKSRGWEKQPPFVFSAGNVPSPEGPAVTLAWEGKPSESLDRTAGCREALIQWMAERKSAPRREIETHFKETYSRKLIGATLKAMSQNGHPLTADRQGRMVFYTYRPDEAALAQEREDPDKEDRGDDVPF